MLHFLTESHYHVRQDPTAPEGYPKHKDEEGRWVAPEGDMDQVGEGAGRGKNLNIPFCGPEVSYE